jgi:YVTN family beta-propeller protein
LYVTNEISGDISVIELTGHTVVATIPVRKRPRGVRVSPDGTAVYVALSGSPIAGRNVDERTLPPPDRRFDGIGMIDVRSGKLVKTLPGGSDPEQLAVSLDGRRLFVANEDAGEVSVVDVAAGEVIGSIEVGGEPEGVDLSPDGRWVYVTSEEDNQVPSSIPARSRSRRCCRSAPGRGPPAFCPMGRGRTSAPRTMRPSTPSTGCSIG